MSSQQSAVGSQQEAGLGILSVSGRKLESLRYRREFNGEPAERVCYF